MSGFRGEVVWMKTFRHARTHALTDEGQKTVIIAHWALCAQVSLHNRLHPTNENIRLRHTIENIRSHYTDKNIRLHDTNENIRLHHTYENIRLHIYHFAGGALFLGAELATRGALFHLVKAKLLPVDALVEDVQWGWALSLGGISRLWVY